MKAWRSKKPSKQGAGLRFSKELLANLLSNSRSGSIGVEGEDAETVIPLAASAPLQKTLHSAVNQVESSMFNYLERKSEKRLFYSYLHRFELTREHLSSKVSRLLLGEIYRQSSAVSQRVEAPVAAVSPNIISTAAWGTIYCLLGPARMIELQPDYRDIADEVELELMLSYTGPNTKSTIYRRVFSILTEHGLCHPEVTALIEACVMSNLEEMQVPLRLSSAG